jgi:hypothetical protein
MMAECRPVELLEFALRTMTLRDDLAFREPQRLIDPLQRRRHLRM